MRRPKIEQTAFIFCSRRLLEKEGDTGSARLYFTQLLHTAGLDGTETRPTAVLSHKPKPMLQRHIYRKGLQPDKHCTATPLVKHLTLYKLYWSNSDNLL